MAVIRLPYVRGDEDLKNCPIFYVGQRVKTNERYAMEKRGGVYAGVIVNVGVRGCSVEINTATGLGPLYKLGQRVAFHKTHLKSDMQTELDFK